MHDYLCVAPDGSNEKQCSLLHKLHTSHLTPVLHKFNAILLQLRKPLVGFIQLKLNFPNVALFRVRSTATATLQ